MMGSKVGEHPGGRAAAPADYRRQFEQSTKRKLAAADAGRLQDGEEPARMELGDRLVRQPAKLVRPWRALGELGDERLGARRQFLEAWRLGALMSRSRRHCDPPADGPACSSLLAAPELGEPVYCACGIARQEG